MSELPKLRDQNFFSHAAAKLVRNTALQGEGITLVLANCVPVRGATFGFSHAGSLPLLRENVCEMAGIKKEPLMNLGFSTHVFGFGAE